MEPKAVSSDAETVFLGHNSNVCTASLPPHIQVLLYGNKQDRVLPMKGLTPYSLVESHHIQQSLKKPVRVAPWERERSSKRTSSFPQISKTMYLPRIKKTEQEELADPVIKRYAKFDDVISKSQFKKIQFTELGMKGESIPTWVMDRLQTSCRSFRYELPFNKKVLEEMTPVQFLANHTRLEKDQRRHYTEIFKKFKQKSTEFLDGKSLYPALNSMFGSYLSTSNYEILQTCLFITDDSLFDVNTFAGLCAFTDRLFWTAYLDGEVDTFTIWAPNRTALEFADFENLKRKLRDFSLSKEMKVLLYSLA